MLLAGAGPHTAAAQTARASSAARARRGSDNRENTGPAQGKEKGRSGQGKEAKEFSFMTRKRSQKYVRTKEEALAEHEASQQAALHDAAHTPHTRSMDTTRSHHTHSCTQHTHSTHTAHV